MTIFISYKSENVNLVRSITERLIFSGVNVWFAEYRVHLRKYDEFVVEFDREIQTAISNCTQAIIFTNNSWADSDYCKKEMRGLIKRIGTKDILEVAIPVESKPHKEYPGLDDNQAIIFSGNCKNPKWSDLEELAQEIGNKIGIDVKRLADVHIEDSEEVYAPRYGLSLRPGPLELMPGLTERLIPADTRLFRSLCFRGKIQEREVTLWLFFEPLKSPTARISRSQMENRDDRQRYNDYRKFALNWIETEEKNGHIINEKGLHIIFINKKSQMIMTFKDEVESIRLWERRYVITIEHEYADGLTLGELRLQFSASLDGDEEEQRRQFCQIAPYMDTIASTVSYKPSALRESLINRLPVQLPDPGSGGMYCSAKELPFMSGC